MNTPPSVSIIIPAWNAGRFLTATLASIQAQTVKDWECVIVSNGSTDDTARIAADWSRADPRFCLLSTEEKNQCIARNLGFSQTHKESKYVTFMDADDIWLPDALESLRNELETHDEAIGAHALAEIIDEAGVVKNPGAFAQFGATRYGYANKRIRAWDSSEATCFESLIWAFRMFPPGLLLTRRKCLERVGLFDASLQRGVDWDLAIRISREGPIRFLNRVILFYRMHESNLSRDHSKSQDWILAIQNKTVTSSENSEEQKRILREGWPAWERFMAKERIKMAIGAFGLIQCRTGARHLLSAFHHGIRSLAMAPHLHRHERDLSLTCDPSAIGDAAAPRINR